MCGKVRGAARAFRPCDKGAVSHCIIGPRSGNSAATIGEAIESALAQDFRDREIIIVNDGSTDATGEMLRNYGERIRVIEQANRGQSAACNTAIAAAPGEYLAFLDSDEYWLPSRHHVDGRCAQG